MNSCKEEQNVGKEWKPAKTNAVSQKIENYVSCARFDSCIQEK